MDLSTTEIIEALSRTPHVLRSLLSGVPHRLLEENEGEGTFTPRDVVAHLIHGEKTDWIPRMDLILQQGESQSFVAFDRFAFDQDAAIDALLAKFATLRTSNLDHVRALELTPSHLKLTGKHPEFGIVTLGQLLTTWVVHDLGHIGQIVRVMSKQFAQTVGPWRAYLGILE